MEIIESIENRIEKYNSILEERYKKKNLLNSDFKESFSKIVNSYNTFELLNEINSDSRSFLNNFDIDRNFIKKDILLYILNHKSNDFKINNINEAINFTKLVFSVFHNNIGGFNYEDNKWNFHDSKSNIFKIRKDKYIFSNSLRQELVNDIESLQFIDGISNFIKKYTTDDIKISWKRVRNEDIENNWILLIIKI